MGCALLPVALARCLGETVNLSTIDMRAAFPMIYSPAGLPAAIAVVVVRHAVPTLSFLLGLGPVLVCLTPRSAGHYATAMAAGYTAQALLSMGLLALAGIHPVYGSLALGASLRLLAELMYGFLDAALVIWLRAR